MYAHARACAYTHNMYTHTHTHTHTHKQGFSSATPKKEVALEYSGALSCEGPNKCKAFNVQEGFCEHHRSTILEISTGQIDRGASLSWVSQCMLCMYVHIYIYIHIYIHLLP